MSTITRSDVGTAITNTLDRLRSIIGRGFSASTYAGDGSPARQPGSALYTPETITCVEYIGYRVEIDDRVDYDPPDIIGEIRVAVPCTAAHLPWSLHRAQPVEESATCGTLQFENYSEVLAFEGNPDQRHTASDLGLSVPIRVPLTGVQSHFASGATIRGLYRYHPQVAKEFPVTITVELSDAPAHRPDWYLWLSEEDRSATYLDELQLQIRIQAHLSNLSQDMEREILDWIDEAGKRTKAQYKAWQKAADLLVEKKKLEPDLRTQLDHMNTLTSEEAQAEADALVVLSRCIQGLREDLRKIKGDLLVEDLRKVIVAARAEAESLDADQNRILAWLDELEHKVGEEHGPVFRYVGIEWPLPEPQLGWQAGRTPFPGEGKWTYNPELSRLECRDIGAEWRPEALHYEGSVTIPLQRPAGAMQMISGRVIVETDRLLSGLNVNWEPSYTDAKHPPTINRKSVIEIDFEADLAAIFKRRRFAVSRRLVFEGLLPSTARVRELKDILADAGLTVTTTRSSNRNQRREIAAIWRREGLPPNWRREGHRVTFLAFIDGQQERAKHMIAYDDDRQQVERSILVGSLSIELKAIGAGDPHFVVEKVNELLLRIQERWGQGDYHVWQGTWFGEA